MRKNKIMRTIIACSFILATTTTAFASGDEELKARLDAHFPDRQYGTFTENGETYTITPEEGNSIATFEGGKIRYKEYPKIFHDHGVDRKVNNSGDVAKNCWGETSCFAIGEGSEPDIAMDNYTRARFEKGSTYKADTGKCWDHDDGSVSGYSSAETGFTYGMELYVGHTYYGYY